MLMATAHPAPGFLLLLLSLSTGGIDGFRFLPPHRRMISFSLRCATTTETAVASQFDGSPDFAGGLLGSDVEAERFDPLGLSSGKDRRTLTYYREAELTHGRLAMMAVVGMITPDTKTHWENIEDSDIAKVLFGARDVRFDERNPIKVLEVLPVQFLLVILAIIAVMEVPRLQRMKEEGREPGNYGIDIFGLMRPLPDDLGPSDWEGAVPKYNRNSPDAPPAVFFGLTPDGQRRLLLSELKHGRLAMIAAAGLLAQNLVTGESFMQQMQGYGFNAYR